MTGISEADWEDAALETLGEPLGWRPLSGEKIAHGSGERDTWDELLIRPRLLDAMRRLNPDVPVNFLQTYLREFPTAFRFFDRSLLLAEKPVQVRERAQLRDELSQRVTGGIYFTTLQKFGLSDAEKKAGTQHPLLTDRRNVIVVVDEAHRSHYDDLDGYA